MEIDTKKIEHKNGLALGNARLKLKLS